MEDNKKPMNAMALNDDMLESVAGGIGTASGAIDWQAGDRVILGSPCVCKNCGKLQTGGTVSRVTNGDVLNIEVIMDCCGAQSGGSDIICRFLKINN